MRRFFKWTGIAIGGIIVLLWVIGTLIGDEQATAPKVVPTATPLSINNKPTPKPILISVTATADQVATVEAGGVISATLTPTMVPTAIATGLTVSEYSETMVKSSERMVGILEAVARLADTPAYNNPVWRDAMRSTATDLASIGDPFEAIEPPPEWKDVHTTVLLAMKDFEQSGTLLLRVISNLESGDMSTATRLTLEAIEKINTGRTNIEYATQLVMGK